MVADNVSTEMVDEVDKTVKVQDIVDSLALPSAEKINEYQCAAEKAEYQCSSDKAAFYITKDGERYECYEMKHDKVASTILLVCLVAFIIAAIIADFIDWKKLN